MTDKVITIQRGSEEHEILKEALQFWDEWLRAEPSLGRHNVSRESLDQTMRRLGVTEKTTTDEELEAWMTLPEKL